MLVSSNGVENVRGLLKYKWLFQMTVTYFSFAKKLTMSRCRFLCVYILKCSDSKYYTGITNNLERRLLEHQSAINKHCFTAQRLPVVLVYYHQFSDFNLAIAWEKRIKSWSIRKKEALINSNWSELKIAAACKNETVADASKALARSRLRSN